MLGYITLEKNSDCHAMPHKRDNQNNVRLPLSSNSQIPVFDKLGG